MKFTKGTRFTIAKDKRPKANTNLEPLDYEKWVEFIDNNQDIFIWNEYTKEGKETLKNINDFSDRVKYKILSTLNKGVCYSEFNQKKDSYNIGVTFYEDLNYIKIQFARTPRLEDLRIFIEMAENLDAYLLVNDKTIITRKDLENGEIV
ncbi:hypothetical protein C8N26_1983 [Tenacibaculum lutimaris]|uniref:Uncharacterized protein n=1 Tax=Tenacibaculum lutimaris TaxID=285258 RepID=A0A420E112_9FLAO|nr:hypothetical protein [Tenacibaculum lutimaris]RKF03593.1 hypothetical protein C8N26_1983 [Tenacibaculum lutimaris]